MRHSEPMNSIGVPGIVTFSAQARRHFARAVAVLRPPSWSTR